MKIIFNALTVLILLFLFSCGKEEAKKDNLKKSEGITATQKEKVVKKIENEESKKETLKNMVLVKAGTFKMLNDKTAGILYDFYINKYEVTNAEYVNFLNSYEVSNDGMYKNKLLINLNHKNSQIAYDRGKFIVKPWKDNKNRDIDISNYPVILVSWEGAVTYCNWLSEKNGLNKAYDENTWKIIEEEDLRKVKGYRLPGIVEWLYVSKGGNKGTDTPYAGSKNLDEVAWYIKNSMADGNTAIYLEKGEKIGTMPVGIKTSNELGVYDLLGNVSEWSNTIDVNSEYKEHIFFGDSFVEIPLEFGYYLSTIPISKPLIKLGFRIYRTK